MLETIQIDSTPSNVLEMHKRGHFHAHPDGKWRYSAFGNVPCVYVNDPTELFDCRGERVFVDTETRLFALEHSDGTKGLRWADPSLFPLLWQMYECRNALERRQRNFICEHLNIHYRAS